eukprot:363886-Chlamydomonas_euryale.AAC.2
MSRPHPTHLIRPTHTCTCSQDDTMCEVHGSQALFKRASSTDKTFEAVDSMWHILTKEPGNEDVLAKALAWFNARAN